MERLMAWASQQEPWVRAVVDEVISKRSELDDAELQAHLQRLLAEKELSAGAGVPQPSSSTPAVGNEPSSALSLEALVLHGGVNALATGQTLSFNRHLTLIFGENASGKSGYVRMFKRLCSARSAEPILADIRAAGGPVPVRATVRYREAEEEHSLEWNGEAGPAPLTRLSVFDTRAIALHLDQDLTYLFTPRALMLYRHAHRALEGVKSKLDAQVAAAAPKFNPFSGHFQRDAVVWPQVEALGANAAMDEIKRLATLTPVERQRLSDLRRAVDADRPEFHRARLQAAVSDVDFFNNLAMLAERLRAFDWAEHRSGAERLAELHRKQARDTDDAFADAEIPGTELPAWRAFLEAAERFLSEVGEKNYPHRGDDCVYCRQPLKPPATALIKRYRTLARGHGHAELEQETEAHRRREAQLTALPIASVAQSVLKRVEVAEPGRVPQMLTEAAALLELALQVRSAGEETAAAQIEELSRAAAKVQAAAQAARQLAEADIRRLRQETSQQEAATVTAREELQTLQNRAMLTGLLPELAEHHARSLWAAAALKASQKISGVLRSLTEQSKAANEESLNRDFEGQFRAECAALRAPPVELDFAGRKGQAARKKTLPTNAALSAVLSEAEQRLVALADFLAELSLAAAKGPVVFDDPTNGLDAKRLEHVADRLATLAAERQVIVFTHHAWFRDMLLRRFAAQPQAVTCWELRADGQRTGLLVPGYGS